MRIALATTVWRRIGGVESYVEAVLIGLRSRGHDVALWCETDGSDDRPRIRTAADVPVWCPGAGASNVSEIVGWKPDVIYSQGVSSPEVELALMQVAPSVLFAHDYRGMCISGAKSRLGPTRMPCDRPLGIPCLAHYLPRRCGGLSPITMIQQYHLQRRRHDLLPRYRYVVAASAHMRFEFIRNGVDPARAVVLTVPLGPGTPRPVPTSLDVSSADASETVAERLASRRHLLFAGRLSPLKGAHMLIQAVPWLLRSFAGKLRLTIVGDGPARAALQVEARRMERAEHGVSIDLPGWVVGADQSASMFDADLLVVPSVWPEPFGVVGVEAGSFGVPAAAFAVGGIPEWLVDGVNGHLAPADPPTAKGLATAIDRCLSNATHYIALSNGARQIAGRFTMDAHLASLLPLLRGAAFETPATSAR